MPRYASFIVLTAIILYVLESASSEQFGENYLRGFDELFGGRERRDSERAFLQQLMQRLKPRFRRDYDVNERDISNLRKLMMSLKPRFKKSL